MLLLLAKSSQSHPILGHSPVGRLTKIGLKCFSLAARERFARRTLGPMAKQRAGTGKRV